MSSVFIAILLIFLQIALFISPNSVRASTVYQLDELNMSISLPEEWLVWTKDTASRDESEQAEIISEFINTILPTDTEGAKKMSEFVYTLAENMEAALQESNTYLNAVAWNPFCEIIITKAEAEESTSFNQYTTDELHQMAKSMLESATVQDGKKDYSDDYSIYQKNGISYIVFNAQDEIDEIPLYIQQYITLWNKQALNIALYSYYEAIPNELATTFQEIIDSIHFQTNPDVSDNSTTTKVAESPSPSLPHISPSSTPTYDRVEGADNLSDSPASPGNIIMLILPILLIYTPIIIGIIIGLHRVRKKKVVTMQEEHTDFNLLCHYCGGRNPDYASRCLNCGGILENDSQIDKNKKDQTAESNTPSQADQN